MICRKKSYKIDDLVTVNHCWGGYWLPVGLTEGATVKVQAIETGYVYVEFEGRQFLVSMACVESGWEYKVNGKWCNETDLLIAGQFQNGKVRRYLQPTAS